VTVERRPVHFNWRGLVLPVGFLLGVELIATTTSIERDAFASPSAILSAAAGTLASGAALKATAETLITAGSGLLLGLVLGLLLGIPLGLDRRADLLMMVPMESLRPVPPVALIPLSLLIFGFGYRMEIAVVAFAVVGPIFLFTRSAIRGIEPQLMEVAHALGLGFVARVTKIVLPAILPRICVAFRVALGIALVVAVTVEITANPLGLGYAMTIAQQSLQPDLMFALLLWIGLTGWSLNALLLAAESRLFGAAA
jgi:ABC-type nitrate/sulfonate/bicarbonate transport system permease component